ncbi:probable linoleate 9S-lipoxygenase 5 [Tanacetum coccineum]
MPYLRRINEGVNKIYASKTLLLLQEDGTLKPLTIELSLPHLKEIFYPDQWRRFLEDTVFPGNILRNCLSYRRRTPIMVEGTTRSGTCCELWAIPLCWFLPNRLTLSHRFMPEPNTPEYDELEQNPENVFLKTITPQLQTLLGISLIELLSKHPSYEVYLGQNSES